MTIYSDFIGDNRRIDVLTNRGEAHRVPPVWRPLLGDFDALVAVPDMHMFFYGSFQDCFHYGARAMRDFLRHLVEVQQSYRQAGRRLMVAQLGDMYELRFPHPETGRPATRRAIAASHPLYTEILDLLKQLKTLYVVGNHDYELAQSPGTVVAATIGKVYMEHGYQADRWYHFTNPDCRLWQSSMVLYAVFRRWEARFNRFRRMARTLREGQYAAFGVLSGERERNFPGDVLAYPHQRLRYYDGRVREEWRRGNPVRICLTAHSHIPLLYTHACNDHCWFVDAGAWTEGRSDFAVITSEEIAVCRYRREAVRVSVPVTAPLLRPEAAMAGR